MADVAHVSSTTLSLLNHHWSKRTGTHTPGNEVKKSSTQTPLWTKIVKMPPKKCIMSLVYVQTHVKTNDMSNVAHVLETTYKYMAHW